MPRIRLSVRMTYAFAACALLGACSPASLVRVPPAPATTTSAAPKPVSAAAAPESAGKLLTLERIHADPPLSGTTSTGFDFASDSSALAFLRSSERDSEVLDLWAVRLPDGKPEKIVEASDLVDLDSVQLSEEERMERERKRVRHTGIVSYAWCGKTSSQLLFPLAGDLYHVKLGAEKQVARLTSDGKPKLDPRCSPKGTYASFVRGGDLWMVDVVGGKPRQLTRGATDTLTHGLAEFVAQEEMGRHRGYFWSPNEAHLAYLRVDTSKVSVKVRPRIYADRTELYEQRYPAAGEPNAQVSLHVLPVRAGRAIDVKLPSEDGYVARVDWSPDGEALWVQWQSRDQKKLELIEARAPRFEPKVVIVEEDDAWVELHDDLHVFEDGDRILWSSERSGVRQIYQANRASGWKLRALTTGPEPVTALAGVNEPEGVALVVRATRQSRERQLYAVRLDGTGVRQVTREPGWHAVTVDDAGRYVVDKHSRVDRPAQVKLLQATGEPLLVIDDNPVSELKQYALPEPTWVTVEAEDGTPLNGLLLPPIRREEGKRYPVVVYVYGGPKAQVAADQYHRFYLFHAYFTQRGYGVFMLDGRGSGNRERAFTRAIYKRFGDIEIEDQIRGARYLQELSWVDPERIGIWGWSYGGYASAMAVVRQDTPFAAAAAVAPVTDWRLYDTHFTERYIGFPQKDEGVYASSDVVPRAGLLKHPLLVMHGMADDNVLFEHSLRFVEALQKQGALFDLMVYPGRAHSLKGKETQLHVFSTIARFFEKNL